MVPTEIAVFLTIRVFSLPGVGLAASRGVRSGSHVSFLCCFRFPPLFCIDGEQEEKRFHDGRGRSFYQLDGVFGCCVSLRFVLCWLLIGLYVFFVLLQYELAFGFF